MSDVRKVERPTRAKYDALAEATKKWKAGMAAEEAWLGVDGWKAEVVGTTYQGGPCPGIEIVDPDAAYQDEMRRG